jgi:hypothetical protein
MAIEPKALRGCRFEHYRFPRHLSSFSAVYQLGEHHPTMRRIFTADGADGADE